MVITHQLRTLCCKKLDRVSRSKKHSYQSIWNINIHSHFLGKPGVLLAAAPKETRELKKEVSTYLSWDKRLINKYSVFNWGKVEVILTNTENAKNHKTRRR